MTLSAKEFALVLRQGVLIADRTYLDWSGGWGIKEGGIEGFVTTYIAKNVLDAVRSRNGPKGGYVALELTLDKLTFDLSEDDQQGRFTSALDQIRSKDPEIAESLKSQARLDLVYYDGCWPTNASKLRPRGIVEVKRWFDKNTYVKDMLRVAYLTKIFGLNSRGSLLYGCFVFFISERTHARIPLSGMIKKIVDMKDQFEIEGCTCSIESTTATTENGDPATAAAISVTFVPQ